MDWEPFVIDEEQIELLKVGDISAMSKFLVDNEKFLHGWAYNFLALGKLRLNSSVYTPLDLVNQVYVDLPLYDYTDKKSLFVSVYRSFLGVPFGGYQYSNRRDRVVSSLNALICGSSRTGEKVEGSSFVDFVASDDLSPLEILENKEHCSAVMSDILSKLTNLVSSRTSRKKKEELVALVEYVFPGYTYEEVVEYVRCRSLV